MNEPRHRTMRVGLVRHGETDWNAEGRVQGSADRPLSERGKTQILELGKSLRGSNWERIISSPLRRAVVSAELMSSVLELPAPQIDERLAERSYGVAEGYSVSQAKLLFPEQAEVAGREDPSVFRGRVYSALDDLAELDCDAVLVVTHGEAIAALLEHMGKTVPRVLAGSLHEITLERPGDKRSTIRPRDCRDTQS
ncbi:histidine phosphatase family protein [Demequina salsinemoris]|uniref:histidine phosphatase family protein n=1 Tax=Demequina salsinemoris TaxID=577470 RepID=UPI000A000B1E|nr:histidine phosphatase family protein [Demequina salsinemoris]